MCSTPMAPAHAMQNVILTGSPTKPCYEIAKSDAADRKEKKVSNMVVEEEKDRHDMRGAA